MFQVFTTFMHGPSMNWLTRYHPEKFERVEYATKHISSYALDECSVQYLSNSRNGKDIYIFSKMKNKKHYVLGYETNYSIIVILELWGFWFTIFKFV